VFAIFTAVYAVRAFGKQAQDVRDQASMLKLQADQLDEQRKINEKQAEILELQAAELRESLKERTRDAAERRRAQANRVFMWTETGLDPRVTQGQRAGGGPVREAVTVHIKNSSEQPVRDVIIAWRRGTAPWGQPDTFPGLLPGEQEDRMRTFPADLPATVDRTLFGAVAWFRDAAGVSWLIHPSGALVEAPGTEHDATGDAESVPRDGASLPPRIAPDVG
jgi:hypothetical protein